MIVGGSPTSAAMATYWLTPESLMRASKSEIVPRPAITCFPSSGMNIDQAPNFSRGGFISS